MGRILSDIPGKGWDGYGGEKSDDEYHKEKFCFHDYPLSEGIRFEEYPVGADGILRSMFALYWNARTDGYC